MRSSCAQGACKLRIRRLHRQSICLRGGRILPNLVLWPCSGLSASPFASQAASCLSGEATTVTKMAKRGTPADFQAAMPVRPLPRPALRARAVSAAIGRVDHPPSTEVHTKRPLQLVPLLRTPRWRVTRATPQYVYQPHQPHQPGSHRRSSLPPDFVHRCARHARMHAQLAADCAVGQAAATASAAQIEHSTSAAQQPTAQVWPLSASRCARPTQCARARSAGLRPGYQRLHPGDTHT
jgi:hypothetical protein